MVAFGHDCGEHLGRVFVSVPAWVGGIGMSYLQMCLGFIVGYIVVAMVLLPLYYRLQLTSIYGYLSHRFGDRTRKTGAGFFLLSKLAGATARLYVATLVLHTFIAAPLGISFVVTAAVTLLLIWLYTDALQTLMLILAVVGTLWAVMQQMGLDWHSAWRVIDEKSNEPCVGVGCFLKTSLLAAVSERCFSS